MNDSTRPLLGLVARSLAIFLEKHLKAHGGENWWRDHVIAELTYGQQGQARSRGITGLGQLDLAMLLRVFERNWYSFEEWGHLQREVRTLAHAVRELRNTEAHAAAEIYEAPRWADIYRNLDTLERFVAALDATDVTINEIRARRHEALAALTNEVFPQAAREPTESSGEEEPNSTTLEQIQSALERIESRVMDQTDLAATVAEAPDPVPGEPQAPAGPVIGRFRIIGPEDSIETEVNAFDGTTVPATEIPWQVTGPAGLEFKIHIVLIDDPDEDQEIGQVYCGSRLSSPDRWDEVVNRLRLGIRQTESGFLYVDLRLAKPREDNLASRRIFPLPDIEDELGFDLREALLRLGANAVATREELTDETSRSRNWPCVTFDNDDLLTPVSAWVATTLETLA